MATTLGEKLQNQRKEWPLGQYRYFIPNSILDDYLTVSAITTELHSTYPKLPVNLASTLDDDF